MTVTQTLRMEVVKPEFTANGMTEGTQYGLDVIALPDGGFALSYAYEIASIGADGIALNIFDSTLNRISGADYLTANSGFHAAHMETPPVMSLRQNGDLILCWTKREVLSGTLDTWSSVLLHDQSDLEQGILRNDLYDADRITLLVTSMGHEVATFTSVFGMTVKDTNYPYVGLNYGWGVGSFVLDATSALLADGGFVTCAVDSHAPENALGLVTFDADLQRTALPVSYLSSGAAYQIKGPISVTGLADGGFAVAYANSSKGITLFIAHTNGDALAASGPIRVDTQLALVESDVKVIAVGENLLVTWTESAGRNTGDILGRMFDVNGVPVALNGSSDPFLIASGAHYQHGSDAAVLHGGGIVVTWEDSHGDGDGSGIRGSVLGIVRDSSGDGKANDIQGSSMVDQMYGYAGNDTLRGETGADRLFGGFGDDRYYIGSDAAEVTEASGAGHDRVFSTSSFALSANLEDLILTGSADIGGTGNVLANLLSGNAGTNLLDGGSGNDTLVGGAGNDTLQGGAGVDRMQGGIGDDWYYLSSPRDVVVERAGQGADVTFQGYSSSLRANVEYMVLTGGADLFATGNGGSNGLFGNSGANTLKGMAGDDGLLGSGGNDLLLGGDGHDYLEGGTGIDSLTGGAGDDEFAFSSTADCPVNGLRDTITDFSPGDYINLSGIDAVVSASDGGSNDAFIYIGSAAFSGAGQLRFESGVLSGDVTGDHVPDFAIVLAGVTALNLGWLIP